MPLRNKYLTFILVCKKNPIVVLEFCSEDKKWSLNKWHGVNLEQFFYNTKPLTNSLNICKPINIFIRFT